MPQYGQATLQWAINSTGFIYQSSQTMASGQFSRMMSLDYVGTWTFQAIWPGDETTNSATSNTVTVTVTPPPLPTPTPTPTP